MVLRRDLPYRHGTRGHGGGGGQIRINLEAVIHAPERAWGRGGGYRGFFCGPLIVMRPPVAVDRPINNDVIVRKGRGHSEERQCK